VHFITDYNCYWDTRSKDIDFAGKSFKDWRKSGKDIHSKIADPLFVDPLHMDFHFKNLSVARKIKFIPFDYSKAGVYGPEEWKKLAELDKDIVRKFDERVLLLEEKDLKAAIYFGEGIN
jgi:hypothetical protein